ncbi:MAG: glycosyltransferase [Gammaproteobacteria bacterium]|nr:glycosyltransferase [Gammaproteobacteria bacterium]
MNRPLVTLIFPCYQQSRFVREALGSVLLQTYSPLQIVISDDCSTDGTYKIVKRMVEAYDGPHQVKLHRNATRMGVENYNTLMELADGEFIVVAHSDDVSMPHRCERLIRAWQQNDVSLLASNAYWITNRGQYIRKKNPPDPGHPPNIHEMARYGRIKHIGGPTLAWERAVFDTFGPLSNKKSPFITDWILPFRAALLKGIYYIDEPLLNIRMHTGARSRIFLGYQDHDANQETSLANRLTQFLYFYETLINSRDDIDLKESTLTEIKLTLEDSIFRTATAWSETRNYLINEQRRNIWLRHNDYLALGLIKQALRKRFGKNAAYWRNCLLNLLRILKLKN